jgi:antitoxin component of RelBE/YafQ-DinJ toxin-antitoxin module
VRTTVNIDDDVLAVAREMAARLGITLGQALSRRARRGMRDGAGPLPVFEVSPDAPVIPATRAQDLLAAED